ncbi:MAG TPA: hypothetical protein VK508_18305 [Cyclobacteriaceae bacterium]|nr:hypothetical protein [Cyclobacteriaceae bacterium]
MSTERELILLCRVRIEQILNWGDSTLWTNSDFELLSDKIFEKTTIRLSISTLKRIWGKVKYDNSPTAATLNALANFLGYASWRDFESEQNKAAAVAKATASPVTGDQEGPASVESTPKRSNRVLVRALTMIALLAASAVVVLLLVKGRSPHRFDPKLAVFNLREISDDLPNSVVFEYDVSAYDADSAFIQQSWDPNRRERVSLEGKQHTSIYYQPGYFQAKLIVNDTIVKEDVVWVKTKGWRGIIEGEPVPIYVSEADIRVNNRLTYTSKLLREKTGSPVFNQRGATFQNVQDFGVSLNSFDFEASMRNTSTPEESICRRVVFTLLTTGGAIIMPISTKGCISELGVLTPDGFTSGKDNDLSAFGVDFDTMQKFKISLHDSVLTADLNDKVIFTKKSKNIGGKVVGIRIAFEGAGEVDYVRLNGQVID